jgi:hypothetical protein
MTMSSFAPHAATLPATPPDPSKHVNYTLGMVLGVDDFTQEFAYLSGRDQWLARDLLGYGTVCGLRVTVDATSQGPRVAVEPGIAVSPQGQLIRVTQAQCAYLNDWLAANKQAVIDRLGALPGGMVALSVVLCYRDCPTDQVPIPGEPCRSEDDMMAPSRLKDDFILELRFAPPDQREEDALRDFVAWLSQIDISSGPSTVTLDEFITLVRQAASPLSAQPGWAPDFMYGSPPISLHLNTADACVYLHAAFRLWVTTLRPLWLGGGHRCGTPPDEGCLLLAALEVPIAHVASTGNFRVDDAHRVLVREERRPYLLSLRLVQEWLMCSHGGMSTAGPPGPRGPQGPQGNPGPQGPPGSSVIVAAGRFNAQGNTVFAFDNLRATQGPFGLDSTFYLLQFDSFRPQGRYVVKGTVLTSTDLPPQVFEVIPENDPIFVERAPGGIVVRVRDVENRPIRLGFMVEISAV